jgi:hypothetical protein
VGGGAKELDSRARGGNGKLAACRFPRLCRLAYLRCAAWGNGFARVVSACADDDTHDQLAELLERCGPSLASVTLDCCVNCYGWPPGADDDEDDDNLMFAWDAGFGRRTDTRSSRRSAADSALNHVLPRAAPPNLGGRRACIDAVHSSLALRKRDIDAVRAAVRRRCRPFPRLRELSAYVVSRGAVRSLVALLTAGASVTAVTEKVEKRQRQGRRRGRRSRWSICS